MPTTKKILFVIALIFIDLLLLRYFNTLLWPYFWPRPMLYILVGFIISHFFFPELYKGVWLFRVAGILMIFVGQNYLIHSIWIAITDFSFVAALHAFGIAGVFFVMLVNFINQYNPKNNLEPPPIPDELPYIAAVIPTYGEPVEILENTARSLKELDYPAEKFYIFISDDGHREEVERLTKRLGIHYNLGAKKDGKAGNLNSALKHLDQNFPKATLLLTQDADEIIDPTFLQKIVGYFVDPKMGFVQTPKEAIAPAGDPFGVRDRIFYDITQPGRNGNNAAFSCGSGVMWRIEAIKSVGGFDTWNIVEDLTTSYLIHSAGWNSEYHNEILSIGIAPNDIPTLLKQRGTWAIDNWRLFLFKNPLLETKLGLRQRLQYLELGLFFVTSALFMPVLMIVPVISLLTGTFIPVEGSALFPWLVISLLYYYIYADGNLHYLTVMMQYWVSHFWTYIKAFSIAVRSRNKKPKYMVTQKTRQDGFYGYLVWMPFMYLLVGIIAIVNGLFLLQDVSFVSRITNIVILAFFMFMTSAICKASFYGIKFYKPKEELDVDIDLDLDLGT